MAKAYTWDLINRRSYCVTMKLIAANRYGS